MSQLLLPIHHPEQLDLWIPGLDLLGHLLDLDPEQVLDQLEDAGDNVGKGEVVSEVFINDAGKMKDGIRF